MKSKIIAITPLGRFETESTETTDEEHQQVLDLAKEADGYLLLKKKDMVIILKHEILSNSVVVVERTA